MARDERTTITRLLFFLCVVSCVVILLDVNTRALDIPRQGLAWVANSIHFIANSPYKISAGLSDYFRDRNELLNRITELELQQLNMAVQRQQITALSADNDELRRLIGVVTRRAELELHVVQSTGAILEPGRDEIYINRGSQHGLADCMAVLDAVGVYGQIVEVLPYVSRVVRITDRRIAVPVQVQRSGLTGILTGMGNSRQLTLEHVTVTLDITEGDLIITSGMGDTYPFGYPVGMVTTIEPADDGVEAHVVIEPAAEINRSRWFVVYGTES